MKQPKRLTRDLKIAASAYGLDPRRWMLLKDDGSTYVVIIHRETKKLRIIDRYAKPKKGGTRWDTR